MFLVSCTCKHYYTFSHAALASTIIHSVFTSVNDAGVVFFVARFSCGSIICLEFVEMSSCSFEQLQIWHFSCAKPNLCVGRTVWLLCCILKVVGVYTWCYLQQLFMNCKVQFSLYCSD
jgi:hypothetical protein